MFSSIQQGQELAASTGTGRERPPARMPLRHTAHLAEPCKIGPHRLLVAKNRQRFPQNLRRSRFVTPPSHSFRRRRHKPSSSPVSLLEVLLQKFDVSLKLDSLHRMKTRRRSLAQPASAPSGTASACICNIEEIPGPVFFQRLNIGHWKWERLKFGDLPRNIHSVHA